MKTPKESDVLRGCLELLRLRGVFHWRQNQGAIPLKSGGYRRFVGLKGVSDIIGILPDGRFLAVEVKRPGGKLRDEQRQFLDRVNLLGGVGIWVDSVAALECDLDSLGLSSRAA